VPRVYIHEVVEVDGTRRAHYQHHMTANWVPEAGPLRRQRCFGVFTLVGSTGPWPRVVNLWEYDSWDDLAHNFSVEFAGVSHRDPMLEQWWDAASEFRRGGFDRILVEHEQNPGVRYWESVGGTGAVAYLQDTIVVAPGEAAAVCDATVTIGVPAMAELGLGLVGLWRTAMRADDEVIAMWGIADWPTWAAAQDAIDRGAGFDPDALIRRQRVLLVDAELSPLRIGRQPEANDRRPITDL
jgi:hypothetical protein